MQRYNLGTKLWIPFMDENDAYEVEYICDKDGKSMVYGGWCVEEVDSRKLFRKKESAIKWGYWFRNDRILKLEEKLIKLKALNENCPLTQEELDSYDWGY